MKTVREVLAEETNCSVSDLEDCYGTSTLYRPLNRSGLLDAVIIPGDRPVVVTGAAIERVAKELCLYGPFPCDWDEADADTKDGWRASAVGLVRVLFPGGVYRAMAVGKFRSDEAFHSWVERPADGKGMGASLHDGDLVAVLEEP